MALITSIKSQKRMGRVNIYLDGKFGFGIDLDNFVKFDLRVGQDLSTQELNKIVLKSEYQKTLDKLLRFATLRPRSEKEVEQWFRKKKVHESLHEKLIDKLKKLDLLDDEKFAVWWVDQRVEFRPRSKRVLKYELRSKGIDRNTIEDVLAEKDINEYKIAIGLYEKKKYRWEKLDEQERKKKSQGFLARKGFGWDVIKKVVGSEQ